ncbi:hypothetical protein AT5G64401 [Arabidopsis thaliana]|uniref:Uncharacterized protein n=1 Tax=Arabidopsis thaliana TaxID=3702 RepID=B3H779_ARATH|nr:uncharacterized protein AT5G64401 [Arabidopsis thaliana]AED97889.1 hypothetical protein AT5G64401 [Arabidopsis thaliana]|eukprot:NP_001119494.1 hypothetical protein AT5G64401 [Arabidopsis thaliana]
MQLRSFWRILETVSMRELKTLTQFKLRRFGMAARNSNQTCDPKSGRHKSIVKG